MKYHKLVVIIFLIVYGLSSFTSIINKSVTYDEIIYVSAGYSLLKTGDYRLNEEHPPLVKILAGIPLLFVNPNPILNDPSWINDDQIAYSQRFFFESGNDADLMLYLSRIPFILLGIILGIFVFIWASELYGKKAGVLALLFYSFSPNILAHSRLAATDFLVTVFLFISFYYFYSYLMKGKKYLFWISSILFGLAFASKFTALYFIPVYFVLVYLHEFLKKPGLEVLKKKYFLEKLIEHTGQLSLFFLISLFVFFMTYSFHFNVFFEGMSHVFETSQIGRFSYLLGEHYIGGKLLFYPIAFLVKTPLAFIFLLIGSILLRKKLNYKIKEDMFLLIPVTFFIIPTLMNKINLGLRHILIIYPFLHVYVSNTINIKKPLKYVVMGLTVLYVLSSVSVYPHYISYFNLGIGGPSQGHKYLLDSNLDWGQDTKLLAQYLEKENISHIYFSYLDNDDLGYRGINYSKLECTPTQGVIAINVNNLFGIKKSEYACNKWLHEFEPYKKIGHTIWIYNVTKNFTKEEIAQHERQFREVLQGDIQEQSNLLKEQCKEMCINLCSDKGREYGSSGLTEGKCGCSCA